VSDFPLTVVDDVSRADWIGPSFTMPFGPWVGSFLPGGYPAYARILHRADSDMVGAGGARWAQVAEEMGTALHSLSDFWRLAGRVSARDEHTGGWNGENPNEGIMDAEIYEALPTLLRPHTGTPELWWVAIWAGWGGWRPRVNDPQRLPMVKLPGREYYLYRGSADDVARHRYDQWQDDIRTRPDWPSFQSPNMIWPDDRAWFVATEVDFDSTLVGGPGTLVRDILAHPDLEAFEVHEGDCIGSAG
jgi:hypothetical protein